MIIKQQKGKRKQAWKVTDVLMEPSLRSGQACFVVLEGVNHQSMATDTRVKYRYDSYEEAEKRFDAVLEFMKNNTVIDGDELRDALDAYVERREGEKRYPS